MSDIRITQSEALLRGLDTMLHKENGESAAAIGASFADVLKSVVNDANTTDAAAHNSIQAMAIGDYDQDVVMLNSTKAELSISLVVQVRDKIVDSYNEIMRMQV